MSNHVHLVVVPHKTDSSAAALKQTHGRYASYWNAVHVPSGHVWQGRFYSCPLETWRQKPGDRRTFSVKLVGRGSSSSCDCRRRTAPRYATWECPAIHS